MQAFLKNYRQSPRKVRLVADLIRRKDIKTARFLLTTIPKRAAFPVKQLLDSAVANAAQKNNLEENLFVKEIRVDEGRTLKRTMPRARGSAYAIRKRTSRISIVLGEQLKNKKLKIKTQNKK